MERKTVNIQEEVRKIAQFEYQESKTNQPDLFGAEFSPDLPKSFEAERAEQLIQSFNLLSKILEHQKKISYEEILGHILELHLVWERDVKNILRELNKNKKIIISGLEGRQTTPQRNKGHTIIWQG
ncbi:MAG: hypothetical protein WD407_14175 [Rhodospirillales bacterium]